MKRSQGRALLRKAARTSLLLGSLLVCHQSGPYLSAQQAPASSAANPAAFAGYDVISVKPSKPGTNGWSYGSHKTTFEAKNIDIKSLLVSAYDIRDALIFGLPKWAETKRWDIAAKVVDAPKDSNEDNLTREQSGQLDREQLQSILRERFQLKAHTETKVMPTYDLVLLPGPPRIKVSAADEKHGSMNWAQDATGNQKMTGTGIPMKGFIQFLSDQVGRNVIDETGLAGLYDMELKYSQEIMAEAAGTSDANDRPPALPQALQEQLGLKLVPSKKPSETLVVDSIQEPAPD